MNKGSNPNLHPTLTHSLTVPSRLSLTFFLSYLRLPSLIEPHLLKPISTLHNLTLLILSFVMALDCTLFLGQMLCYYFTGSGAPGYGVGASMPFSIPILHSLWTFMLRATEKRWDTRIKGHDVCFVGGNS